MMSNIPNSVKYEVHIIINDETYDIFETDITEVIQKGIINGDFDNDKESIAQVALIAVGIMYTIPDFLDIKNRKWLTKKPNSTFFNLSPRT